MGCPCSAHRGILLFMDLAIILMCGCQAVRIPEERIAAGNVPRELTKILMPEYVVEPPDLLRVEAPVVGISGDRDQLVRPDGTISLGNGQMYVAGLTLTEIKEKIILRFRKGVGDEAFGLIESDPETGEVKHVDPKDSDRVFVDVTGYNSKCYYVMGDVAAPGRLPITGNETVLDAIHYAGGLIPTAATQNIRLVRPVPPGSCCAQILPVNLAAIINAGDPTTNYQLMPGDRIVVSRDPIVRTTIFLNRLAEPFNIVINSGLTYLFFQRFLSGNLFGTAGNNNASNSATNNTPAAAIINGVTAR